MSADADEASETWSWDETLYAGSARYYSVGRMTSPPEVVDRLVPALGLDGSGRLLDVGCGLGYSAAVIARLAETVVALEEDEALAADAQRLLSEEGVDNAVTVTGKLTDGSATCAPYDVITIEGGVEEIPAEIWAQLKDGGRIGAIFMDSAVGTARIGYKAGGQITWRSVFNAAAPVLPGFAKPRGFVL